MPYILWTSFSLLNSNFDKYRNIEMDKKINISEYVRSPCRKSIGRVRFTYRDVCV